MVIDLWYSFLYHGRVVSIAPHLRRIGFGILLFAAVAWAQDRGDAARSAITRYCTGCHNERARTGGLVLNPAAIPSPPETWEKVVLRLRMRTMPPSSAPRPDEKTYTQTAAWIENQLDTAAAANPNPGQPLLHRLNRTEYANAIEDLLGLKVDVAAMLPPDDSAFGFDNNSSVLGISPVLLERYLTAADRVSALALADPTTEPGSETYRARQDLSQDQHIEGLPFGPSAASKSSIRSRSMPNMRSGLVSSGIISKSCAASNGRIRSSYRSMVSGPSCGPSAVLKIWQR
jgi:hypothetical protein